MRIPSLHDPLHRLYVLRGIGSSGDRLLQFAVPLLIYKLTGSVAWSGLSIFVEWVPRLISLALAGSLVDRFGVSLVYRVSDSVRLFVAASAVIALLVLPTAFAGVILIVLTVVAGFCFEQSFIAGETAVKILAPDRAMHGAQSVLGGLDQATLVLAPAVGGVLAQWSTLSVVGVTAVLFASSRLLVGGLADLDAADSTVAQERNPGRHFLRSARYVLSEPVLRLLVALAMLVNFMLGVLMAVSPAIVTGEFELGDQYLGLVYGIAGVGSVLAIVAGVPLVRRFGLFRLGQVSAVGCGLALTLLGLTSWFGVYALLVTLFMAFEALFTVFIRSLRAQVIPDAQFASTVGAIVLLNFASVPAAGLVVAVAAGAVTVKVLLLTVGGLSGVAVAVVCHRIGARLRSEPKPGVVASSPI